MCTHVQSRTFQLGNNRDIIKAVIYKWANFPVHILLERGQLVHRRASVAGMQHWPGYGPRLLPRNMPAACILAATRTTLLTFSWSVRSQKERERRKRKRKRKKEKKKGREEGKKVARLYVCKRRGRSPWVCADDKVPCSTSSAERSRIYEHESVHARAHETRRTVYFSEYCRERCAPNDCLSTALRSCSDTWKYSRGRAYRNIPLSGETTGDWLGDLKCDYGRRLDRFESGRDCDCRLFWMKRRGRSRNFWSRL